MESLIVPFKDNGHMSEAQKNFNKILSSSRVIVEHTFGILKSRFRQLFYCKLKGQKKLCHFIRACCVLHNLIDYDDKDILNLSENCDLDWSSEDFSELAEADERFQRAIGCALRLRICREIFQNNCNN
jgi:hypothetical protein